MTGLVWYRCISNHSRVYCNREREVEKEKEREGEGERKEREEERVKELEGH